MNLLWASLKIKSLAYAYKQHPAGLLTFAVIQMYLPDTCLQSGQFEARPGYQIIAAEGIVVHYFEPVIANVLVNESKEQRTSGKQIRKA